VHPIHGVGVEETHEIVGVVYVSRASYRGCNRGEGIEGGGDQWEGETIGREGEIRGREILEGQLGYGSPP